MLARVRSGELGLAEAEDTLRASPYGDLEYATIDHHRTLRQGHPEIVFAPGKTPEQAAAIAAEVWERSGRALVTRAGPEHAAAVGAKIEAAHYEPRARTVRAGPAPASGGVTIVSAGTADEGAALEARETCRFLGVEPAVVRDVGVAGVHRLLRRTEELRAARAVIAVAGMEGALASVVAGLVAVPVVALPTSVGYGTGVGGVAALMTMLNSCAANVACVNIDNGVGAAVVACLIAGNAGEAAS